MSLVNIHDMYYANQYVLKSEMRVVTHMYMGHESGSLISYEENSSLSR